MATTKVGESLHMEDQSERYIQVYCEARQETVILTTFLALRWLVYLGFSKNQPNSGVQRGKTVGVSHLQPQRPSKATGILYVPMSILYYFVVDPCRCPGCFGGGNIVCREKRGILPPFVCGSTHAIDRDLPLSWVYHEAR